MKTILGISGSLRKSSLNSALLRAAQGLMPDSARLELGTIAGIPLYDGDVESAGFPAPAAALKDRIAEADAVLLVTPEYNNSIPGTFKNAIDWTSRPPTDSARVWAGRRVALIGASPSAFGTILSQDAWLAVLRTLGAELWTAEKLMVSRAQTMFDAEGQLTDGSTADRLRKFLAGFVASLG